MERLAEDYLYSPEFIKATKSLQDFNNRQIGAWLVLKDIIEAVIEEIEARKDHPPSSDPV